MLIRPNNPLFFPLPVLYRKRHRNLTSSLFYLFIRKTIDSIQVESGDEDDLIDPDCNNQDNPFEKRNKSEINLDFFKKKEWRT